MNSDEDLDEDADDDGEGWESEAPAPKKVKKSGCCADHDGLDRCYYLTPSLEMGVIIVVESIES